MSALGLVAPSKVSQELTHMVNAAAAERTIININSSEDFISAGCSKYIFALEVSETGTCPEIDKILSDLIIQNISLKGCSGAILVHSRNELFTKSCGRSLIFNLNRLGMRFPGHPLIEATGSMKNFQTWKKTLNKPLDEICYDFCEKLASRLEAYNPSPIETPQITVLHSSMKETSNTLKLWEMVKVNLSDMNIKELNVENGTVQDCKGCSFKMCLHYSQKNSCFYGGVMVKEIMPAVEKADALILLCPNYNDTVSANISAVINRITALYRKISFYNKTVFSIIVSGNSGSDLVAEQVLGALNINKGFQLPPNFALMETANDPKSILKVKHIDKRASEFALNIRNEILGVKVPPASI